MEPCDEVAETAATDAGAEKHEETSVRRALEASVRTAEAELARERERRVGCCFITSSFFVGHDGFVTLTPLHFVPLHSRCHIGSYRNMTRLLYLLVVSILPPFTGQRPVAQGTQSLHPWGTRFETRGVCLTVTTRWSDGQVVMWVCVMRLPNPRGGQTQSAERASPRQGAGTKSQCLTVFCWD